MKPTLAAVLATLLTGCVSQVTESPVVITNAISMYSNTTVYVPQPFLGGQIALKYYREGVLEGVSIGLRLGLDYRDGKIDNFLKEMESRVENHIATNELLQRVLEIEAQ